MIENPTPETFNPQVWDIVRQVPRGTVTTFSQLATMIPPPDGIDPTDYARLGPRWVGDAMNAVSFSATTLPYRGIVSSTRGAASASRRTAAPGNSSASVWKPRGIVFGKKDTCSLEDYGWDGPDAAWLDAHGLLPPKPLRKPNADGGQMRLF